MYTVQERASNSEVFRELAVFSSVIQMISDGLVISREGNQVDDDDDDGWIVLHILAEYM